MQKLKDLYIQYDNCLHMLSISLAKIKISIIHTQQTKTSRIHELREYKNCVSNFASKLKDPNVLFTRVIFYLSELQQYKPHSIQTEYNIYKLYVQSWKNIEHKIINEMALGLYKGINNDNKYKHIYNKITKNWPDDIKYQISLAYYAIDHCI